MVGEVVQEAGWLAMKIVPSKYPQSKQEKSCDSIEQPEAKKLQLL